MKIRIAHSPDADDAFMFYALAHGKIDTEGLVVEHLLQDIQKCNEDALVGKYEVSAISFATYPKIADRYALLTTGSSMGEKDYGPMLIAKQPIPLDELATKTIAIPGAMTTAALLLKMLAPKAKIVVFPFDQIMSAVKQGTVEVGLIIHEGQLTYQSEGLVSLLNFGTWWWEKFQLPLPLGGNVVRRDLGPTVQKKIARLLKDSILYALEHRQEALVYASQFSRKVVTDPKKVDQFVGWYVNERTLDMGVEGKSALAKLLPGVKLDFVEGL